MRRKHPLAGQVLLAISILSISAHFAVAQGDAPNQSGPSPEKAQLIKDVLTAARANRNAQMGYDLALSQELKGMSAAVSSRIDGDPRLTADQKTEGKRLALAAINRRMTRLKQLMSEKINITQLVNDTYLKMYDKYFTVQELKDMLAWYQSPTGQKSLDTLPKLTDESMALINASVMPKIREISLQMADEEKSTGSPATKAATPTKDPAK